MHNSPISSTYFKINPWICCWVYFRQLAPHVAPADFHVGEQRCRGRALPVPSPAPELPPSSSEPQRDQHGRKRPGGAGEGSRGWLRALPPAPPTQRSRPAPSAPAGALTPLLLRKHLLSFKVAPPPFRHGENKPEHHHSTLHAGRGKRYPKTRGPSIGRNPTVRRGTACAHCAPAFRPSPRNSETSRPAAHFP